MEGIMSIDKEGRPLPDVNPNEDLKKKLAFLAEWELNMEKLEEDMQRIVDMHWNHEKTHWEETGNGEDHVFNAFNNIKNYLTWRRDGKNK